MQNSLRCKLRSDKLLFFLITQISTHQELLRSLQIHPIPKYFMSVYWLYVLQITCDRLLNFSNQLYIMNFGPFHTITLQLIGLIDLL